MNILYLSTNNVCRSILAESITRKYAPSQITAMSGGSNPSDDIHPVAYRVLKDRHYSSNDLVSKSWDLFAHRAPDIVITLCDRVLKKQCPSYVGKAVHVHWGLPDPVPQLGNMEENIIKVFKILDERIKNMFEIDLEQLDKEALRAHLKKVAQ